MPKDRQLTVYDFGMNNGDDVEYYLKKGHRVVGVEANNALCKLCEARFRGEIASGDVVILNVALARESSDDLMPFYIHKTNHVLSQVTPPSQAALAEFDVVQVRQRLASDIIRQFGEPYYVKIDIEHFDQVVLADLFDNNIRPAYISAESHSVEIFAQMVVAGYRAFNLVDGITVPDLYGSTKINTTTGVQEYSFQSHSAGPFGDDISSPWLDQDSFLYYLAKVGLGWKDIHATLLDVRTSSHRQPQLSLRQHLADFVPSFLRAVSARMR